MITKTIFLIILVVLAACKPRNKLNTDEQQLTAQILQEEVEKEALKKEKASSAGTTGSASGKIRLKDDRSIDSNHPPFVLDIIGSRDKIKPVKYSGLGKSVRYIFLTHPNDSLFFKHGVSILFTPGNIITTTWRGIARFDKNGQFIEMICKDGQKFIVDEQRGARYSTRELMDVYIGSQGAVSAIGDKIFYKYVNKPNEKVWLMEYDASPENRSRLMPAEDENNEMQGKGEKITQFSPKMRGNITLLDEEHWITDNRKFASSKSGIFMTVHSLTGDTVCSLKDHDPVTNFSSSVYRGVERGDNYKLNGKLHFRQNFNDTIYRFESTNRLVPIYAIDFGERGVASSEEAITPKFDLKEKFVYKSTFETKGFLFFLYTQNYASPNNAKRGALKYNRFVLNKNTGEMFHAYVDADPYMPNKKMTWPTPPQKNIINDLDFGPARWPTSQTENGKIYHQLSGKELKEHVQNNQSNSNQTNREQIENIAKSCSDDDVLIMIIE